MSHSQSGSGRASQSPTPWQIIKHVFGLSAIITITGLVITETYQAGPTLRLFLLILVASIGVILVYIGFPSLYKLFQVRSKSIKSYARNVIFVVVGMLITFFAFDASGKIPPAYLPNSGEVYSEDTDDLAIRSLRVGEKEEETALSATIINRRDHPIVLKRLYWTLGTNTDITCPRFFQCLITGETYYLDPTLFLLEGGKAHGSLTMKNGSLDGFSLDSEVVLTRGYSKVFRVGLDANLTIPAHESYDLVLVLPRKVKTVGTDGYYYGRLDEPSFKSSGKLLKPVNPDYFKSLPPSPTLNPSLYPIRPPDTAEVELCFNGVPNLEVLASTTDSDKWASSRRWLSPSSHLKC